MNLTNKQLAVIEKMIAETIYDGKTVDFSNEVFEQLFQEIKKVGIPADKVFLKKVFNTMIEKYESDPKLKEEIKTKQESCAV